MKLNLEFGFRNRARVFAFVASAVLSSLFVAALPAEAWQDHSIGGLKMFSVPAIALGSWVIGAFLTLMVKAGDSRADAPGFAPGAALAAGVVLLALGAVLHILLVFAYA